MLVNNVDISNYKAELLDRAISTTVVHSITDWMDEATEGSLLRQAYDWRNIKLTFLIREIDEDQAYKRISALTEALKNCTLRFDDIELDFPCVLDGTTVPDRLQNGVFKVVFNLKNDWALGEPVSFTYHVAPANAKMIHVKFVRSWAPVMEAYMICFDNNEIYEDIATEDFYIDLALVEELANRNTSWSEFFLELGVPVNKYKLVADLNGFLDINDEYSPAKAKEVIEARDEFTVYYNRYHKDGYPDFPEDRTYPSLVWKAREGNIYYFDTGIGNGWNIQDISVVVTGRWYDIMGVGCMFGVPGVNYSLWKDANEAFYLTGGVNPYHQKVFEAGSGGQSENVIIETLEPIADVPLRDYGIKSSNEGSAPVTGFADLVFNGITLTRVDCASLVLDKNLTIGYGFVTSDTSNKALDRADIARVRIYHKGELVQDLIPIAGNLKNCFINDYDDGFYDTISMKFIPWISTTDLHSRQPEKDLMFIPGMPDIPTPPPAPATYAVTVVNGSGSGSYEEGALVTIQANDPGNDMMFDKWVYSDPITLTASNETNPNSFAMIPQEVTVTATFKEKPVYVEPRWLLYYTVDDVNAETDNKLVGTNALSWDDEPTAGIEFVIAFSVPGVSNVSYYPSGSSGKTLKKLSEGTSNTGRFWVELKPNSSSSFSGCDITGTYNGETYTQYFKVHSLF